MAPALRCRSRQSRAARIAQAGLRAARLIRSVSIRASPLAKAAMRACISFSKTVSFVSDAPQNASNARMPRAAMRGGYMRAT
jgi:hypothetical protein